MARPQRAFVGACSFGSPVKKTVFHLENRMIYPVGMPSSGIDLFDSVIFPALEDRKLALWAALDSIAEREWLFHTRCESVLLLDKARARADREREDTLQGNLCNTLCNVRQRINAKLMLAEPGVFPSPMEREGARLSTRPDIPFVARQAEAAGIDLRILVLARPALQLLVQSSAKERGFSRDRAEARHAPARATACSPRRTPTASLGWTPPATRADAATCSAAGSLPKTCAPRCWTVKRDWWHAPCVGRRCSSRSARCSSRSSPFSTPPSTPASSTALSRTATSPNSGRLTERARRCCESFASRQALSRRAPRLGRRSRCDKRAP